VVNEAVGRLDQDLTTNGKRCGRAGAARVRPPMTTCAPLALPTRVPVTVPSSDAEVPPQHLILLTLAATATLCEIEVTFAPRASVAFSYTVEARGVASDAFRTLFAEPETQHVGKAKFSCGTAPLMHNLTHVRLAFGRGPLTPPSVLHVALTGVLTPDAHAPPPGSASLEAMQRASGSTPDIFVPATFALEYNGQSTSLAFAALDASAASSAQSHILPTDVGGRPAVALRRDPSKWASNNSPRFIVGDGAWRPRGNADGSGEVGLP
jgi:hypothetical protein